MSATSLPLIHWALLQVVSPLLATLPVILFAIFVPLIQTVPGLPLHPMSTCTFLAIFLRLMDVALLDKEILQSLSFYDYVLYVGAFRLPEKKGKKGLTTEKKATNTIEEKSIPYENLLSVKYLAKVALDCALKFTFYYFSMQHLQSARKEWNPTPFVLNSFNDLPLARDYLLLGFALMFILDISVTIGNHGLALFFRVPYVPIMNAPYLATSVRDFWVRWNVIVQRGLRRVVFDPVVYAFGYGDGKRRIPASLFALAGFATFVFSGIMHEWMILAMTSTPTTWEQQVFFTLQGVIVLAEIIVQKTVKGVTGIDLGKVVPYPVQVLYALTVGVAFNPLFHNPLIREGIYFKFLSI